MIDIIREIEAVHRRGRRRTHGGRRGPRRPLERDYDAPIDDVWDAVASPERIGRWFLPISGDFRVGGRYQLEGNAGGEILACDQPNAFKVDVGVRRGHEPGATSLRSRSGWRPSTRRRRGWSSSMWRSSRRIAGPSTGRAPWASAGMGACSGSTLYLRGGAPSRIPSAGRCPTRAVRSRRAAASTGARRTWPQARIARPPRERREHDAVLRAGPRNGVVTLATVARCPGAVHRMLVGTKQRGHDPSRVPIRRRSAHAVHWVTADGGSGRRLTAFRGRASSQGASDAPAAASAATPPIPPAAGSAVQSVA